MGLDALSTEELEALDSKGLDALPTEALERLDQEDEVPFEAPNPIRDTVDSLGRLNESLTGKAVEMAKPVAAPVDAAIKKADDAFGAAIPKPAQALLARAASEIVTEVADTAGEQLGIPGIAMRHTKDVAAGAIGLGSGAGGVARAVGFENIGNLIAQSSAQTAKDLMPPDPNITDAIAQGLGSMAAFMIPGMGVTSGAGAVAVVAPRLGAFLGIATASILEAGTEAGEVYNRVMEKTNDPIQANVAAGKAFWANLPLIHFTNKLGWAGDQSTRAARALESFVVEGGQEGGQQLISNFTSQDPIMAGVVEAAFVGGIVGGVAGGAAHGVPPAVPGQSTPPAGPPGTPPTAPPAGPAAPVQAAPVAPAAQEQAIPSPEQLLAGTDAPAPVPLTNPNLTDPAAFPAPKSPVEEPTPKKKGKKAKATEEVPFEDTPGIEGDDVEQAKWKAQHQAETEANAGLLTQMKALYDQAQAAAPADREAIVEQYDDIHAKYEESKNDYNNSEAEKLAGFKAMPAEALRYRYTSTEEMEKSPEYKAAVTEATEKSSSRAEFRENLAKAVFERDIPVSRMVMFTLAGTKQAEERGLDHRQIADSDETLGGGEFNGTDRIKERVRIEKPMLDKLNKAPVSKEKKALLAKFEAKLKEIIPDEPKTKGKKKKGSLSEEVNRQNRGSILNAARIGEISEDVVREIVESGKAGKSSGSVGTVSILTKESDISISESGSNTEFKVSKTDQDIVASARAFDLKKEGLPASVNAASKERLVQWVREYSAMSWRNTPEEKAEIQAVIENFDAPAAELVAAVRSWKHSGRGPAGDIIGIRGEAIFKDLGWPTNDSALYRNRHTGSLSTLADLMHQDEWAAGRGENRDTQTTYIVDANDPVTDPKNDIEQLEAAVKESEGKLVAATTKPTKAEATRNLDSAKKELADYQKLIKAPGAVNPGATEIPAIPEEVEAAEEETASEPEKVGAVESATQQLEAAGYPPSVAKTLSVVFEGFRVLGERAGIDPQKLFDRYGVKIVRGEQKAAEGDKTLDQPGYHGSPHQFDKFDLSKMGTGEGAQAYGWGAYIAGKKEVGQFYRDKLSESNLPTVKKDGRELSYEETIMAYFEPGNIVRGYGGFDKVIKFLPSTSKQGWAVKVIHVGSKGGEWVPVKGERERIHATTPSASEMKLLFLEEAHKLAGYTVEKPGRLYKVEIPEDSEYLDWDKPLSEQSEKIQKSVASIAKELGLGGANFSVEKRGRDFVVVGTNGEYRRFQSKEKADREAKRLALAHEPTGELIYRALVSSMGSVPATEERPVMNEERASMRLSALGIPGIRYADEQSRGFHVDLFANEADKASGTVYASNNFVSKEAAEQYVKEKKKEGFLSTLGPRGDTSNYVIFDANLINIMEYEQKAKDDGNARGRIRISLGRQFSIEILEGADLSTFLHEAGHLYLEILGDIALEAGANPKIKADYQIVLEWLGVKSREEIQTVHHEQFARGFEAYLMEGKAPSSQLQTAFNSFKSWLGAIYKQLSALEVDLTPEVRRVFDRMLATDAELKTAVASAEKAVAKARKRKSEADSQAPPQTPQDAVQAAQSGVPRAEAQLKKAEEKAAPVAKQKAVKAGDRVPMILGVKRAVLESMLEDGVGKSPGPQTYLKPAKLEKYINAGLLASDFTVTDLAKKAVAELERVKELLKKGYIDDTSLVQPKKITLKSILKGLSGGPGGGVRPALLATIRDGWITDGKIMFRLGPDDAATVNLYKHLGDGHTAPQIEPIIKLAEGATDSVTGILGAREPGPETTTYLLGTEAGRLVIVSADYYEFFKTRYPDAKFFVAGPTLPIRIEQYGELAGLLMPMKAPKGDTKDIVINTETGEEIVKKVPKGRAEVDSTVAAAETLRRAVVVQGLLLKANEKEIKKLDKTPGEKTAALITKIAILQNENNGIEKKIDDARKEISSLEDQAAALREAHGIEDIPASGLVRKRPKGKKGGAGASSGDFAMDTPVELGGMEHIKPFRMPELVRLAYELMGKVPDVGGLRTYNGYFRGGGTGEIKLNPIIFQKPEQAAKTLAHEIGHLIDYLPDHTLKRGNLLGRLRTLASHLSNTYGTIKVTNKELRDELMAVTMYWRPYDPVGSSASYISYRKSGKELYADAISMLFNTPGTLERMAPNFYREFFAGLDAKPAVKLAFFELQAFLNSPEIQIQEYRHLDRKAMYLKAEDLWRQKRAEQDLRDTRYGEWFKQLLVEKHQKVIGEIEAAASKGNPLPASRDPRYILEEMSLADNNNHAFLEEVDAKVVSIMTEAEISHLDMGDYLYLSRVALGDRQAFANPKGYNPEEAAKALDFMKIRLGLERYAKLEAAASNFREIVYQLSKQATAVGAYNIDVFDEKIEPNRGSYAVFAVQEHLEDYITAGVKEQVGTLKDIANPFTATIMKMIALNRLIAKQKGANAIRDFLVPRGEATKAEVIARGDKLSKFREKKGFGMIEMLENGRPVAYYVDPYIAEAFQRKEAGTFQLAVKILDSVFNGLFRPLYITFNIGFQFFSNPVRDFSRTRRNVYALIKNQGYAGTVKSLLMGYAGGLGSAGRRAAGIDDALISEMIANKSLDITFTDYSFDPDADQYTSVLRKMGMAEPGQGGILDKASKYKILKPVIATLEAIRFIGNTFETISKVAGYKVLKADSLATLDKAIAAEKDQGTKARYQSERAKLLKGEGEFAHELAYNTRNYIGTPNWRRRGTITNITNTIFPFSNIMIQGLRSDLEIATRPNTRTGFMFDMTMTQVMPKFLMLLAALGGAGDDLEEFFRKISEYDKSNYLIIPIGFEEGDDGKRKAVYARIPHDETGRIIAAVFWKMANAMRGDPAALQQIVDFGAGQMPTFSPPITIGANWVAYLSGKNPYDSFRGRPIMPEKVYEAGGIYALKKMVQWTASMAGLSAFTTHDDSNKTTAESILQTAPLIGRIFKISDYGEQEEDMKRTSEKQSESARLSLDRGEAAKQYTKELRILSGKVSSGEASSDERKRYGELKKYRHTYDAYTRSIRRADIKGDAAAANRYREKLDAHLSKVIE